MCTVCATFGLKVIPVSMTFDHCNSNQYDVCHTNPHSAMNSQSDYIFLVDIVYMCISVHV